jgi:hypothetical protein
MNRMYTNIQQNSSAMPWSVHTEGRQNHLAIAGNISMPDRHHLYETDFQVHLRFWDNPPSRGMIYVEATPVKGIPI